MKTIERKSIYMTRIETKLGGTIEEILRRMYVDENLSSHQISKELNISYKVVVKWLKLAGVYSRNLGIG